jgi:hypothetical protein
MCEDFKMLTGAVSVSLLLSKSTGAKAIRREEIPEKFQRKFPVMH